jgi:hypothetical protein
MNCLLMNLPMWMQETNLTLFSYTRDLVQCHKKLYIWNFRPFFFAFYKTGLIEESKFPIYRSNLSNLYWGHTYCTKRLTFFPIPLLSNTNLKVHILRENYQEC